MKKEAKTSALMVVAASLGLAAVLASSAFFIYKFFENRLYLKRWEEWDNCGY